MLEAKHAKGVLALRMLSVQHSTGVSRGRHDTQAWPPGGARTHMTSSIGP